MEPFFASVVACLWASILEQEIENWSSRRAVLLQLFFGSLPLLNLRLDAHIVTFYHPHLFQYSFPQSCDVLSLNLFHTPPSSGCSSRSTSPMNVPLSAERRITGESRHTKEIFELISKLDRSI